MSDSNLRSKKFLHRIRARTEPAWKMLVGWGTFFHNLEKVIKPLWRALHSPYVYPWVLVAVGGLGLHGVLPPSKPPPDTVQAPAAPKTADQKSEAPKILAPLDKPKPDCIALPLLKIRESLSDLAAAEGAFKRTYAGRFHCGWYLTVAAEPVPTGTVWRVSFRSREGIRVIAEVRTALPLYEGDIVQVGGMMAEFRPGTFLDKTPTLIVQRAWIQKR